MNPMTRFIAITVLCMVPVIGAAQSNPLASLPPESVVAVVDGVPIRLNEVDAFSHTKDPKKLFQLNQQLFALREESLSMLVGERLLAREARKERVAVEEYVDGLPVDPIDEKDVETLVADSLQRNAAIDPDKLRGLVRQHLLDQKRREARRKRIEELKLEQKKAGRPVVMQLEPPRVKVQVSTTDPSKGNGAVEIIEFSDFECPYCRKAQPIIRELMAKYDGKVKLVWKDYPLSIHQNAVPAAVAARCAGEQGKFWEYHDVLFENQEALASDDLSRHAATVRLDVARFKGCLRAGKYRDQIASGLSEARNHPIEATPTFLINGRMVTGAAPLYELSEIVEQELGN